MRPSTIRLALTVWNSILAFAVLLVIVLDRMTGSGISARSSLSYPVWILTLVYAVATPVTSLAGAWLANRAELRRLMNANLGFFLLWLVLLVGTFVVR